VFSAGERDANTSRVIASAVEEGTKKEAINNEASVVSRCSARSKTDSSQV